MCKRFLLVLAYKNKSLKRSLALLALLVLAGPEVVDGGRTETEVKQLLAQQLQQQNTDIYQKMQADASFISEGNSEKIMQFFE